jgi:hypothetical protein
MKATGVKKPGSSLSPVFCEALVGGYCELSNWPMLGSLNKRVNASLNTSLTSLVLVSWFGDIPKR